MPHVAGVEQPAPDSAPAAESPSAPVQVRNARVRGVLPRKVVIVVALFTAGFGVSWFLKPSPRPRQEGPELEVVEPDGTAPAAAGPSAKHREQTTLQRGKELLHEGRFEQALTVFQLLADESKNKPPPRLALYLALCHEELGQWTKAQSALQTLAAHGGPVEAFIAQIGQARLKLRRHETAAAQNLLWPIVLQAKRLGENSPLRAEAEVLLALALGQETLPPSADETLAPRHVPPTGLAWSLDRQLDWHELTLPRATRPLEPRIAVSQEGERGEQVIVEALLPRMAAAEVIERVAAVGKRTVEWSVAAHQSLEGRTLAVAASQRRLPDLLQDLAASFGLVAVVAQESIDISTPEENTAAALAEHRLQTAQRHLRSVAAEHREHLLAPAACLALGHLHAQAGPAEALAWYGRVLHEMPRSRLTVDAGFQQALLLRQAGRHAEARDSLFQVVDQAPGHPLTPLAWLHLGQIYLEEGDWRKARSVLPRGEVMSSDESTRAATVLALAAAALQSDEPRGAIAYVTKNRDAWPDETSRHYAAFLAAYARFRLAEAGQRGVREGSDLTIALLRAPAETSLGAFGQHLRAGAFADLGMWSQAAELYGATIPKVQGPLAQEMTFRLGEALVRLDQKDEARRQLLALVDGKGSWAGPAQYQLAALEFKENRLDACLDRCRKLLQAPQAVSIADILTLMGRTYERRGRFADAARCYSGQIPD